MGNFQSKSSFSHSTIRSTKAALRKTKTKTEQNTHTHTQYLPSKVVEINNGMSSTVDLTITCTKIPPHIEAFCCLAWGKGNIQKKTACLTWGPHTIARADTGDRTQVDLVRGKSVHYWANLTCYRWILFKIVQQNKGDNWQILYLPFNIKFSSSSRDMAQVWKQFKSGVVERFPAWFVCMVWWILWGSKHCTIHTAPKTRLKP